MRKNILGVGIVGAGLIGTRRARIIQTTGNGRVVVVADTDSARAAEFAQKYGCERAKNWKELAKRSDIEVVIIAVPNKFIKPIAIAAFKNGKHVFSEKPLGRNVAEAEAIVKAAKKYRRLLKVGFNHRFHPAIFTAKKLFDEGRIGRILFIRGRYGHGGRLGMEKEWRFQKDISGGGELLDQGVHLIDLMRWFAGEFKEVYGITDTKFWNTKLDDNAFAILRNKKITASLHVSTTNWKNVFSFEIFGDKGFLTIDGLGRSYGEETLIIGKRKPEFGVPEIEVFKFSEDPSWEDEWKNFIGALTQRKKLIGDGFDGWEANRIVGAIYESSKRKKVVKL
jgi:predicted dehydrogenase